MNAMLLMLIQISGEALLGALLTLVIAAVIFWLLLWFVNYVGIPEPFNKVVRVVLGLAAIIFLVNWLLGLMGHAFIRW
jgi:hypothetical protein